LFGSFRQRSLNRRRIALVSILHGNANDRIRRQVNRADSLTTFRRAVTSKPGRAVDFDVANGAVKSRTTPNVASNRKSL
jgi:hypothetical protein